MVSETTLYALVTQSQDNRTPLMVAFPLYKFSPPRAHLHTPFTPSHTLGCWKRVPHTGVCKTITLMYFMSEIELRGFLGLLRQA